MVSAVVNGNADRYGIARRTQDRIRAAINQLGYRPNLSIRNLFLNRRQELDGHTGSGQTPDPLKIKAVIEAALAAAGYQLPVLALTGDPATARAQASQSMGPGLALVIGAGPVISDGWQAKPVIVPDDTQGVVSDNVEPPIILPDDRHADTSAVGQAEAEVASDEGGPPPPAREPTPPVSETAPLSTPAMPEQPR